LKVLVIGGGGREHALVWKIRQSPKVDKVYCIPGNAGIAQLAECVAIDLTDLTQLADFAAVRGIDLTVVGPEQPLTAGIVDVFQARGLRIFGPTQAAAMLEGSKVFAKQLMDKYGIPTARSRAFTEETAAVAYLKQQDAPIVVKADGLAAGKGVIVAQTVQEAIDAVRLIMGQKAFGDAGKRVLIEEYLEGEEVSILAFTDGQTIVPMVPAQDHKRIFEGDQGPNTGGMGVYSPVSIFTDEIKAEVQTKILQPTIAAMAAEGRPYRGVLYAGLMLTADGPKVLEYNVRFGDPEAQVVLPRLKTDLVAIMEAVIDGKLAELAIEWLPGAAAVVVAASGGYPGNYEKGKVISGLAEIDPGKAIVFHAGTTFDGKNVLTAGGRVLGVTALGDNMQEALNKAYTELAKIKFTGMYYRRDIGYRELAKQGK